MTSFAQDERFSVACYHDPLPQFLARTNAFQSANVVYLKWPCFRFTVFAFVGIQSLDEFRLGHNEECKVRFHIQFAAVNTRLLPRLEPEKPQRAHLAFDLVMNAIASII